MLSFWGAWAGAGGGGGGGGGGVWNLGLGSGCKPRLCCASIAVLRWWRWAWVLGLCSSRWSRVPSWSADETPLLCEEWCHQGGTGRQSLPSAGVSRGVMAHYVDCVPACSCKYSRRCWVSGDGSQWEQGRSTSSLLLRVTASEPCYKALMKTGQD